MNFNVHQFSFPLNQNINLIFLKILDMRLEEKYAIISKWTSV